MPALEKLVGNKYGRLLVVSRSPKSTRTQKTYWDCLCDCGKNTVCTSNNLKNGFVRSCGCLKKEMISKLRSKDISGTRFGRLTVVKRADRLKSEQYRWICKCDCGNEKKIATTSLVGGLTESCGCLRKELLSAKNSLPENLRKVCKLLAKYRSNATNRGISFELTLEFIITNIDQPCFYCQRQNYKVGFDRINSGLGYTLVNTVPCCRYCNFAKHDLPVEEFADYLDHIHRQKTSPKERILNQIKAVPVTITEQAKELVMS